MNAPDLLAEFSLRAGIPRLELSESGTARLVIDDTTTVDVEHAEAAGRLFLYSSLGDPPEENREAVFLRLLAANLFGYETGGAIIGYDTLRQEVLVSRALDLDSTEYKDFEAALEDLVDTVERLREELVRAGQGKEGGEPDDGLAGGMIRV